MSEPLNKRAQLLASTALNLEDEAPVIEEMEDPDFAAAAATAPVAAAAADTAPVAAAAAAAAAAEEKPSVVTMTGLGTLGGLFICVKHGKTAPLDYLIKTSFSVVSSSSGNVLWSNLGTW